MVCSNASFTALPGGVGVTADIIDRVDALVKAGVDAIVIDTAHGHSKGVIETLKKVKKTYPNLQVVVGNIATPEAALALAKAGADAANRCETLVFQRHIDRLSAPWDSRRPFFRRDQGIHRL